MPDYMPPFRADNRPVHLPWYCWLVLLAYIATSLLSIPVSAATLTGEISGENYNSTYWTLSSASSSYSIDYIHVKDIELISPLKTLIRFDNGAIPSYSLGGNSQTETFRCNDSVVTTQIVLQGTGGYQRFWNNAVPAVEQNGYQWMQFSSINTTGLTGEKFLQCYYSGNNTVFSLGVVFTGANPNTPPSGGYLNWRGLGQYLNVKESSFSASYTATKPSGLGITGSVSKSGDSSRAIIYDAITGVGLSSEASVSMNNYSFNAPAESIIIGIRDAFGNQHNSSILFAPTTPTTTTTPIGPENPLAPGYVRTMAQCVDGQTSGAIHGCSISLKDVQASTWSNVTNRFDGTWFIDTLGNHTIDVYGTKTGYTATSRTGLAASGSVLYELIMWPSDIPAAPAGKVNLYVIISDADTGNAVSGAQVVIRDASTGINYAYTTGTSGTVQAQVTNSSTAYITATRYGYDTASETVSTSASGTDTVRIEMYHTVVTTNPTATIPPAGVTTATTINPNDPSLHGGDTSFAAQEMMGFLGSNGMALVELCFAVTMLALLGVKLGK